MGQRCCDDDDVEEDLDRKRGGVVDGHLGWCVCDVEILAADSGAGDERSWSVEVYAEVELSMI